MAGDSDNAPAKVNFERCKMLVMSYEVCVACGKFFRKIKFIDETRLYCCDHNITSNPDVNKETDSAEQIAEIES